MTPANLERKLLDTIANQKSDDVANAEQLADLAHSSRKTEAVMILVVSGPHGSPGSF